MSLLSVLRDWWSEIRDTRRLAPVTVACDEAPAGLPEVFFSEGLSGGEEPVQRRATAGRIPVAGGTLADMSVGGSGRILGISGQGAIRQRLLDMGVTRGATVVVKRVAPFGDPIEISIKGYDLAVRRAEAQAIRVEPDAG